jgi:hypothetical protein
VRVNPLPILFVLGVVVAGAFVAYSVWANGKRQKALAAYAASNRWSFTAEDDALTVRWHGTPFGQGDRRRARNVLSGTARGRRFVGFEYQYDTASSTGNMNASPLGTLLGTTFGNNRERTTHHFFVVAVALPTYLPSLEVTPENLLSRAAAAVGIGSGVELESEDFNRHFRVTARNPKFASDVLTPRTMQAMLSSAQGLCWRIEGADVVSWGNGHLEPVALLSRLSTLNGVVDGIPDFVWHDNGYDPHPGTPPVPPVEGSSS